MVGSETNWDIIGHETAVQWLQRQIAAQRVHHAYLFVGPRGVGRRTLARRFAQALTCLQPPAPGAFCGQCRVCRQIAAGVHPDFHVLHDPAGLKVDAVRQAQQVWNLSPREARYRIALLPEVQHATPAAANALLKTLEEPPAHLVLLLTASDPDALLPTVVSRCEVVRLRLVPRAALEEALQARGAPPAQAAEAAAWAQGRPGRALRLLEDPQARAASAAQWRTALELLAQPLHRRLRFAEPFKPSQRDEARQILSHWLDVWRAVWRMQWAPESVSAPPGWEPTLRAWAQAVPPDETRARLEDLLTALEDLERYANPRLVLGAVLMAWPQVHLAPPRPT